MVSKTKYKIDDVKIKEIFQAAGIDGVTNIAPLGAGEYNAVYSAKSNGKEYAIKIAPPDDAPILTYEKDMMAAEVFWYEQLRKHTSIVVPEVYKVDFDRSIISTNYFIMEKLAGTQLDKTRLSKAEKAASISEMAKMAAQIHKINNSRFGYIQQALFGTWYEAIRSMAQSIINDAHAKEQDSRRGEKLLAYIDKYATVLEKAECAMVNFDIWPANIICRREKFVISYAWIDPERSFWGDRICDFVCFEFMNALTDKKASLSAYNSATDKPIIVTDEENIRFAIAMGYLALIMEVEKYYRYTPRNVGWKRNVLVSDMLYHRAFITLKNGR
jgi:aminoglycoside phosphotransferase (APT) family kinase protein